MGGGTWRNGWTQPFVLSFCWPLFYFIFFVPFFFWLRRPCLPVSNCTLFQMACNRLAGIHHADPSLTFFRLYKLSQFVQLINCPCRTKKSISGFFLLFPLKQNKTKNIAYASSRIVAFPIQLLGRHHQLVAQQSTNPLQPRLASRTPPLLTWLSE